MKTLDQRILIPAPPNVVWQYLSDIANNSAWQADCQNIVFLSQRRRGPGVRWRYATEGGHEYICETTAWYEGFGYEYSFVDGAPFKKSQGRLRLQEIAEGTVVQWTFMYEAGGPVGAVRNLLGLSRRWDSQMVDSLKHLWRRIGKAASTEQNKFEPKSLMRDAPDYEARSQYKPRYPSIDTSATPVPPPPVVRIVEPPVVEDDTRPRPAAASPYAPPVREPDFLTRDSKPDTKPVNRDEILGRTTPQDDDIFKRPSPASTEDTVISGQPYAPPSKPVEEFSFDFDEPSQPPIPAPVEEFNFMDLGDDEPAAPASNLVEEPVPITQHSTPIVEPEAPVIETPVRTPDELQPIEPIHEAAHKPDEPADLVIEPDKRVTDEMQRAETDMRVTEEMPRTAPTALEPVESEVPQQTDPILPEVLSIVEPEITFEDTSPLKAISTNEINTPVIEQVEEAPTVEAPIQDEPRADELTEKASSPLDEPFVRPTQDISGASIWDVFGVPRPSEGPEDQPSTPGEVMADQPSQSGAALPTLADLPAGPPLIDPLATSDNGAIRIGLRRVLRQRLVSLRQR